MARYMPQRVFDCCAIFVAKCYYDDEVDESDIIAKLVGSYQNAYVDDRELLNDIDEAAKKVLELVRTAFPDKSLYSVFEQLSFLSEKYELDGRKRRRKILGGTMFNKEKQYNTERVKECVKNVLVYHTGTMTGFFPLKDD